MNSKKITQKISNDSPVELPKKEPAEITPKPPEEFPQRQMDEEIEPETPNENPLKPEKNEPTSPNEFPDQDVEKQH